MYPAKTTMSIELTQCCLLYCLLCMKQTRFVYCLAMIVLLHVSSIRLPSSAPRPAAIFLSLPLLHVLHITPSAMDFHLQYESSYDEQNRLDGLVLVALLFGNKTKHTTSRFFRNPSRSDREQTPDSALLEPFHLIAHNCNQNMSF
jgi:hypothetical protein